jgi:hypothetical protein
VSNGHFELTAIHLFAIDAAEKLNEHGEKAQVVVIGPTWSYDQDISRGVW